MRPVRRRAPGRQGDSWRDRERASSPCTRCFTAPATSTARVTAAASWSTSRACCGRRRSATEATRHAWRSIPPSPSRTCSCHAPPTTSGSSGSARQAFHRAGLRVLAEREDRVDSSALGHTAREEEPHFWQVGVLVPGRRGSRSRAVRRRDRDRGEAGRTRCLPVRRRLRLQGDGCAAGAAAVLRRPLGPALRDRLAAGPQPLLHEHVAVVHARAAVLGPRPQRRDQHDRPPARRVPDAGRADPATTPPTPRT